MVDGGRMIKKKEMAVPKKTKIKAHGVDLAFDIVVKVLAVLIIIIVMYPLIYVVSASLSSPLSIMRGKVWLLPDNFTLKAYISVFKNQSILTGYKNTIIIAVIGTFVNLLMTTLCAYPLSRKDFAGRNVFTIFITFTMFFSAGMIPNFLLVKNLGLLNNIWSLILPGSVSVYNMLIMRNYFQNSIPDEIIESATIDGCGNVRTLVEIVIPLSKSILAVLLIFYAVGHWNSYFDAMIYLSSEEKYPLQLILRQILLESTQMKDDSGLSQTLAEASLAYVSLQYAVIVVSSLPLLIVYPFIQKYFAKGIMVGAVKG